MPARIRRIPKPVIAQVHGYCLAAGMDVMLACDFAIADPQARLGMLFGDRGILGGTVFLPRYVGMKEYEGYTSMLVGLRVPTAARRDLSSEEAKAWRTLQKGVRNAAAQTLPMRGALERAYGVPAVAPSRAERRRQARG